MRELDLVEAGIARVLAGHQMERVDPATVGVLRRVGPKREASQSGPIFCRARPKNAFHRLPTSCPRPPSGDEMTLTVPAPDMHNCDACGRAFRPARRWSRFCRPACRLRAHRSQSPPAIASEEVLANYESPAR